MKTEIFQMDTGNHMNYLIMQLDSGSDLPLLIYLHGAGERGKKTEHLYRHGIPKLVNEGKEIPAIILCPQCPQTLVWNSVVEELKKLIDTVVERYSVKKDRISITGSSMVGFGTWDMITTYGNYFSSAAPVAGGGMSWRAPNIKNTPVRAYHGTKDKAVPIIYSQLMVDAVNTAGGSASLIELNNFEHNDGIDEAYRNTDLIEWLLKKRRTDFKAVPETCSEWF